MQCTFLIVSLIVINGSLQNVNTVSYDAAVVEFAKTSVGTTYAKQINQRLGQYVDFINDVSAASADIMVFPEATLNDQFTALFVPDASEEVTPCGNTVYDRNPIQNISCAARRRKIYVVINLTMKRVCSTERAEDKEDKRPCPDDDLNLYNTNVVFDRNGRVISVYRKVNLFGEGAFGISTTRVPDVASFHTDFGVEFGHFICFDILFGTPANDLIRRGITNFAFPTMWYSEIPFLSAVQLHQGWAYAHNVNMLAAGANRPWKGSSGSGIYAGRQGALRSLMSDVPESKILVSTIQKVPGTNVVDDINGDTIQKVSGTNVVDDINGDNLPAITLTRDWSMNNYSLHILRPSLLNANQTCVDAFCCLYVYRIIDNGAVEGMVHYTYFFVMYYGKRWYGDFGEGTIRVCAVVASTTEDSSSCGTVFPAGSNVHNRYQIDTLEVGGTFKPANTNDSVTMPSTLTTRLLPLPSNMFTFNDTDNTAERKQVNMAMSRLVPGSHDLLTFGVYSQEYSSSYRVHGSIDLLLLSVALIVVVF